MTLPDDGPRRPPPSTGRQDRHRRPSAPQPESAATPAAALPPRGAAHYAKGRAHQIGLGCLVALFVAGALAALVLLVLGLSPSDDFVPAGGAPPAPHITETPAGGTAPGGDAAPAGDGARVE